MSYNLFLGIILLVAVILILIVMVQNPKGGGLSSSFGGGAQSLGGVQNTNNFLDRTTWTLAIAMFALILLSNFSIDRGVEQGPILKETLDGIESTVSATPTPVAADTTKDSE